MKKEIYDESNGLYYTLHGDYYLPNLVLPELAKAEGITEELKARDQMRWGGLMNNIHSAAEEIVMKKLVYV